MSVSVHNDNVSAGWRHEWRSYPNNAPEAIQLITERNDGAPNIFTMRAINTGFACIQLYQHKGSPAMPIDDEVERFISVVVVESSTERDEATTSLTCAERLAKHRPLAEEYAGRTRAQAGAAAGAVKSCQKRAKTGSNKQK